MYERKQILPDNYLYSDIVIIQVKNGRTIMFHSNDFRKKTLKEFFLYFKKYCLNIFRVPEKNSDFLEL